MDKIEMWYRKPLFNFKGELYEFERLTAEEAKEYEHKCKYDKEANLMWVVLNSPREDVDLVMNVFVEVGFVIPKAQEVADQINSWSKKMLWQVGADIDIDGIDL